MPRYRPRVQSVRQRSDSLGAVQAPTKPKAAFTKPIQLQVLRLGSSSLRASFANCLMSVLGVGQLTLAYAMKEMGVVVGVVSLALFGVLSIYSLAVLAVHTKRVRSTSYPDLIQKVLGTKARFMFECAMVIQTWGVGVGFLIFLKEQLHILFRRWSGGAWKLEGAVYMISVTAACIFPLSLLRKFDRLKFSSTLGCVAALWITLVVVVVAPWADGGLDTCALASPESHVKPAPESAIGYFRAMSLLPFALNMSWFFPNCMANMRDRTPLRVTGLILGSNSIVLMNYTTIAVIGYLSYCGTITPNVMDSLQNVEGWRQVLVQVARVALVAQLMFSLPIRFNATRDVVNTHLPALVPHMWYHVLVTTVIVGSAVGVASTNLGITVVLGITSSVAASSTIYTFPASLEIANRHHVPTWRILFASMVCFVGLIVLVAGLYSNIVNT